MRDMRFLPLLFVAASVAASADDRPPIATDRPGFSDGTNLVSPRTLQFEGGFFRTQLGSSVTTSLGDGLFRYGMNDKFELRLVGLAYGFGSGTEQWLEPSIGCKFRLFQGPEGEITFIGQTTVPIGAGDLRSDEWNPTFKLAGTTPLGKDTLGGNVAFSRFGSGASRYDQGAISLFLSRPLDAKNAVTGEVWFVDRISRGGPGAGYGSIAVAHLVNNDTQLDLRLGTGFNSRRDGWFLQGGVSVRF